VADGTPDEVLTTTPLLGRKCGLGVRARHTTRPGEARLSVLPYVGGRRETCNIGTNTSFTRHLNEVKNLKSAIAYKVERRTEFLFLEILHFVQNDR